jgi:hypothetical protein
MEGQMRFVRIYPALPIASLLIAAFALVSPAKAQPLDGNYQCVRLEFQGRSAPCQSPPLILNQDGSYEIWGERGTYEVVQGHWLVLSHSKRRGLGHFVNSHDIVFEYPVDGRVCRVTFRRVFEAPPGFWWD